MTDLIKKADIAMYEAKKTGKNRVETYREGNDSVSGRRLDMEKNMRDATVERLPGVRGLLPAYHRYSGRQGCLCRSRGTDPLEQCKAGIYLAGGIHSLAEYLGPINPIGNYVLTEACTRCKHWNDIGYTDYKVNVNLSVVQLLQPDIVETVEKALCGYRIVTEKSHIGGNREVLRSTVMDRMKEILNRSRALGVSLALDDFGTGYLPELSGSIPIDASSGDQSFKRSGGGCLFPVLYQVMGGRAGTDHWSQCLRGRY